MQATKYLEGAIAPNQWDRNPDELYPWLEYALMAQSVENEIRAEELAKQNTKSGRQPARQPYHSATFTHDE